MYWIRQLAHKGAFPSRQLNECTEVLLQGLHLLGEEASTKSGDQQIIVGGSLARTEDEIPDSAIIWNMEQAGTYHFHPDYVSLMKRCRTWDYNTTNMERLKFLYDIDAEFVPFGYVPNLETPWPATSQDIDVCFLGSLMSTDRRSVTRECVRLGLSLFISDNCYGPHKAEIYARSKVVLNMHFHSAKIMESLRIGYALANRKAVVCQVDQDSATEADLEQAVVCSPLADMPRAVMALVKDDQYRHSMEQQGYEIFKQRRMQDILKRVL